MTLFLFFIISFNAIFVYTNKFFTSLDLISKFRSNIASKPDKKEVSHGQTKSDGELNVNVNKNKLISKSEMLTKDPNNLASIITQVPQDNEKIDIQKLTNIEEIKDYYEYTENCLQLISKLTMPSMEEIEDLRLDLPDKFLTNKKKLAIFDLDETLIHCELKNPSKAEKLITIKLPNGNKARVSILFIIDFD